MNALKHFIFLITYSKGGYLQLAAHKHLNTNSTEIYHKWPPVGDVMSVIETVSFYRWSIFYPAVLKELSEREREQNG